MPRRVLELVSGSARVRVTGKEMRACSWVSRGLARWQARHCLRQDGVGKGRIVDNASPNPTHSFDFVIFGRSQRVQKPVTAHEIKSILPEQSPRP